MTNYPCVADTDSIALVVAGSLHGDLILDDDLSNALLIDGARGLGVPFGVVEAGRAFRSGPENITTGDTLSPSGLRFDTTNGQICSGSAIATSRNGIWLIGGSFAFNTAAAVGQVVATLKCNTTVVGIDSGSSPAAFGGALTSETIALNPCGIIQAPSGAGITVTITHNFGGTIPTVGSTNPPTTATVGALESGGMEWWAVLLEGL